MSYVERRWYHRPLVRRCALALARALMDAGYKVDVFAWSWPDTPQPFTPEPGGPVSEPDGDDTHTVAHA